MTDMTPDELRKMVQLAGDVSSDRAVGTEDHWWHSQLCDFYLDEDFGDYAVQKGADKRRMLRLPALERATLALAAALDLLAKKDEELARKTAALEAAEARRETQEEGHLPIPTPEQCIEDLRDDGFHPQATCVERMHKALLWIRANALQTSRWRCREVATAALTPEPEGDAHG